MNAADIAKLASNKYMSEASKLEQVEESVDKELLKKDNDFNKKWLLESKKPEGADLKFSSEPKKEESNRSSSSNSSSSFGSSNSYRSNYYSSYSSNSGYNSYSSNSSNNSKEEIFFESCMKKFNKKLEQRISKIKREYSNGPIKDDWDMLGLQNYFKKQRMSENKSNPNNETDRKKTNRTKNRSSDKLFLSELLLSLKMRIF